MVECPDTFPILLSFLLFLFYFLQHHLSYFLISIQCLSLFSLFLVLFLCTTYFSSPFSSPCSISLSCHFSTPSSLLNFILFHRVCALLVCLSMCTFFKSIKTVKKRNLDTVIWFNNPLKLTTMTLIFFPCSCLLFPWISINTYLFSWPLFSPQAFLFSIILCFFPPLYVKSFLSTFLFPPLVKPLSLPQSVLPSPNHSL